jgi:hypothetical protein
MRRLSMLVWFRCCGEIHIRITTIGNTDSVENTVSIREITTECQPECSIACSQPFPES